MSNAEMNQLSAALKEQTNEVAHALGKKVVPYDETSSTTRSEKGKTVNDKKKQ